MVKHRQKRTAEIETSKRDSRIQILRTIGKFTVGKFKMKMGEFEIRGFSD
jgi:hypothetical protein